MNLETFSKLSYDEFIDYLKNNKLYEYDKYSLISLEDCFYKMLQYFKETINAKNISKHIYYYIKEYIKISLSMNEYEMIEHLIKEMDFSSNYIGLDKINTLLDFVGYTLKTETYIKLLSIKKIKVVISKILDNDINTENTFVSSLIEICSVYNDIDNVSNYLSDIYYKEISSIPLLSKEEEQKLIIEKEYSKEAFDKLVVSNLRLVRLIAKRYAKSSIPLDDLIEEGNIGLMKAVKKVKPMNSKFSTYAVYWIRNSISRYIIENDRTVRIPNNRRIIINRVLNIKSKLEISLGREATVEDLATELDMEPDYIEGLLIDGMDIASLDKKMVDDEIHSLVDFIPSQDETIEEILIDQNLKENINDILNILTDRERQILISRKGLDGKKVRSLSELASKYKLTKERIRQIEFKAIEKIKKSKLTKKIEDYYEKDVVNKTSNNQVYINDADKTIFQILKEYPKQDVITAINKLPAEYELIFDLRFGSNLDIPRGFNYVWDEKLTTKNVYDLIKYLKNIIKNKDTFSYKESHYIESDGKWRKESIKTIYERYNDISKEDIDELLEKLPIEEKKAILNYFSSKRETMTMGEILKVQNVYLVNFRKNLKNHNYSYKKKEIPSIYQVFSSYTEEKVNNTLNKLEEDERKIILKYYSPLRTTMYQDEKKLANKAISKFKRALVNENYVPYKNGKNRFSSNVKTIYKKLSNYSKEDIDKAIDRLPSNDKDVLLKYYSDRRGELTPKEKTNVNTNYLRKLKKILNDTNFVPKELSINCLYKRLNLYTKEEIDAAIEKLPEDIRKIILNYFSPNRINMEKISKNNVNSIYIRKIISIMNNARKGKKDFQKIASIYETFNNHDKQSIDKSLSLLKENDREELLLYYSKERFNMSDERKRHVLAKVLRNFFENLNNDITPIVMYPRVIEYSKEKINKDNKVKKLD